MEAKFTSPPCLDLHDNCYCYVISRTPRAEQCLSEFTPAFHLTELHHRLETKVKIIPSQKYN